MTDPNAPQYSQPSPPPPPPAYGQQQYPQQPPAAPQVQVVYAAPRPTNTMSILALIFAFVFSPLGVVFGHIGLSQIKRTGEQGRGLAIAGLVIGYLGIAVIVLYLALIFFAIAIGFSAGTSSI